MVELRIQRRLPGWRSQNGEPLRKKTGAIMQQGAGVYRLLTLPRYTQKNRREFFNKASANAPAVVQ